VILLQTSSATQMTQAGQYYNPAREKRCKSLHKDSSSCLNGSRKLRSNKALDDGPAAFQLLSCRRASQVLRCHQACSRDPR